MKKIKILENIAKEYGIGLIYLFGSLQKSGYNLLLQEEGAIVSQKKEEEDIDVGIIFIDFPKEGTRYVYGQLYEDLSPLFSPYRLDLVFLQETDYILQWEAINGISVYKSSEDYFDDYEERVMKYAADWKFEYELYQKEFLEGMRDGYCSFEYNPSKR